MLSSRARLVKRRGKHGNSRLEHLQLLVAEFQSTKSLGWCCIATIVCCLCFNWFQHIFLVSWSLTLLLWLCSFEAANRCQPRQFRIWPHKLCVLASTERDWLVSRRARSRIGSEQSRVGGLSRQSAFFQVSTSPPCTQESNARVCHGRVGKLK